VRNNVPVARINIHISLRACENESRDCVDRDGAWEFVANDELALQFTFQRRKWKFPCQLENCKRIRI
jgi:hypothetical protein